MSDQLIPWGSDLLYDVEGVFLAGVLEVEVGADRSKLDRGLQEADRLTPLLCKDRESRPAAAIPHDPSRLTTVDLSEIGLSLNLAQEEHELPTRIDVERPLV